MTKRVIRDYFVAFRWENVKKFYHDGGWFMILYVTVVLPLIMQYFHSEKDAAVYYFILLPMLVCIVGAPLHPVALPKIMYLCPMNETERREYICKSFWFKITFPLALNILSVSILVILKWIDGLLAVLIMIEAVLLGLVNGIDGNATLNWGGKGFQKPVIKELEMWLPAAGVIGMLQSCFVAFLAMGERETWTIVMWSCVVVMLQLPITIKVMRYYRRVMDNALNYDGKA